MQRSLANNTPHATDTRRRRRSFRFEDMWMKSPECEDVTKNAWTKWEQRYMNLILKQKPMSCRKHLINWSRKEFDNNRIELKNVMDRLRENAQNQYCIVMQREE